MFLDILTLGTGFLSFASFLIIHAISFRQLPPERLLKSLLRTVLASMAIAIVIIGLMFYLKFIKVTGPVLAEVIVLSILIDGLLCFFYVLCIFGPSETSVRMRLVREIARGKDKGISMQELLSRYNAETIVNIRLRRLVGSGDIIEKDGSYVLGRTGNFFFIFDTIAGVIKRWIEK